MIRNRDEALYLAHLVVRGLYDEVPEKPSASMSLADVFELACWNSITGLTWHAVKMLDSLESSLRAEWEEAALETALRRIQFDAERNAIIRALSERGISSMPIKGATISSLYPSMDMRSMADNDILYGSIEQQDGESWRIRGETQEERLRTMEATRSELIAVMNDLGYVCDGPSPLTESHDINFFKPPFLSFEMHHAMLNVWYRKHGFVSLGLFSNPWEGAVISIDDKVHGTGFLMRREPEIEYAYYVLHAMKHCVAGGIGLRCLADLRVMLDAWGSDLNWRRTSKALESCGVERFESDLRNLCNKVFDGGGLATSDEDWLVKMAYEGTYGFPLNKSYAVFVQRLAARADLVEGASLPGNPLVYVGNGRVSRPLFNCFAIAWNVRRVLRSIGRCR